MKNVLGFLGITATALFFSTAAFASVNDDQVTSQKIREADGTSGQNTNSGSGVKTGHIQDGAVTSGKLADGAVTDAKISGPISASKIDPAGLNADTVDGLHAADLAPAAHGHPQSEVTGLESALAGKAEVTHDHDTLYQQKYGKVAVVAQTGGDYTSPIAAMSDLAAWCGSPSAANPCLVRIMPGIYDIGQNILDMQPYVDIEGSGERTTVLTGNNYTVVHGGSDTELRFLTLRSVCQYQGGSSAMGYHNESGSNIKITHTTVELTKTCGAGGVGIYTNAGNPFTLNDVTVTAVANEGDAVGISMSGAVTATINNADVSVRIVSGSGWAEGLSVNNGSNTTVRGGRFVATGGPGVGVFRQGYGDFSVTLNDVDIEGSTYGIVNMYSAANIFVHNSRIKGPSAITWNPYGGAIRIAGSKLDGGGTGPTALCAGVTDGNYVFYANTCP